MDITFDAPPLNEVALGRVFLPRQDFLVPHFGAFWQEVRDQFPGTSHAPQVADGAQDLIAEDGVVLPRVWLLSEDSTQLVQLQQNRFYFNWRQTSATTEYIRFQRAMPECVRMWERFSRFVLSVTGQPLQPVRNEMTYTNYIDLDGAPTGFEIARQALKDHGWQGGDRVLAPPSAINCTYQFEAPNSLGTLKASVVSAMRTSSGLPTLKLELTLRGKASDEVSFESWLVGAHDYVVQAFVDLTTAEMHRRWKLREA